MSDSIYKSPTGQIEAEILIEGDPVQKKYPPIKIIIEKALNEIPKATVHIIDGSPVEGDDSFKAAKSITIGKSIEIKAGYDTKTELLFKGVITGKNTEQDTNENPLIILECHDTAIALKEANKTAAFQEESDADIITKIVKDYSGKKTITIKDKTKFETLMQHKISNWDFIKLRAQINGCVITINDGELTIAPPAVKDESVRTLKYGDAIKEQSLTVSDHSQPVTVEATCWDPSLQEQVKAVAEEPSLNKQGDTTGKKLAENKGTKHVLETSVYLEKEALKTWANAYLLNLRLTKINGRINVQGDPKLLPNKTITLEGFGKNYNGNGYIGAIKHTILPGDWDTEIQLGLPEDSLKNWKQGIDSRVATFKGLQTGIVKKIDEDPKNEHRILVTIPSQPELKEGIWARFSSLYAPKEKGFFFYPEVGDELVLGFVEGHSSNAIILGSLFSKKNAAPYTPDDKNSIKAIITKSELKIEFNDEKKITTIATPAGNEIILSDEDKEISITDEHENTITLNKDGVVIKSKGDIKLEATKDIILKGKAITMEANTTLEAKGLDIHMKAKKAIALEGSATAELKAGGKTTVKGALLALN